MALILASSSAQMRLLLSFVQAGSDQAIDVMNMMQIRKKKLGIRKVFYASFGTMMTACGIGTLMSQGHLDQLMSFGCQFQDFLQLYVAISNQLKHDNPTRRTSVRILA